MRFTRLGVPGILLLATVFAGAGHASAQGLSPGPLTRVHASLEGATHCTDCHSSGSAIDPGRCLHCHEALGRRIQARTGYHARVQGRACERCHVEHRGRAAQSTRWPDPGQDHFDHTRLARFELSGAHAQLRCRQCHEPRHVRAADVQSMQPSERGRTFLGLGTACASCHRDPHTPSLGSTCTDCHDQSDWNAAQQAFDHSRARFPLHGAHARVACAQCHPTARQGELASFRGVRFRLCTDCHEDPHTGAMGEPNTCTRCHAEAAWDHLRFDHATHAPRTFPLDGAHAALTCARCHGEASDESPQAACASCHRDAHAPSLGSDCARCHSTSSWTRTAALQRDLSFHDRTNYPLRGAHRQVDCNSCHDPRKPLRLRYRPIAHAVCSDCHQDPHRGELAQRPDHGACESCHDVDGFTPPRFGLPQHAQTRFPLDGSHVAVPCAGCHRAPPEEPGFRVEDRACATCHTDPHGGQFSDAAGPMACDACHTTAAFSPSTFDAERHAGTGFALVGGHHKPCARCHGAPPATPAAPEPVVQFAHRPSDCGDCHRDWHHAQFRRRACRDCHQGQSFRTAPGFHHEATAFPLEGAHARVDCSACHHTARFSDGRSGQIFALGPRLCGECHESPHGDADARAGSREERLASATSRCVRCHTQDSFDAVVALPGGFDHRLTRAPLEGGHAQVACARCHDGGDRDHDMSACGSCHEDRHMGRMTRPCAECHTPRSWRPDGRLEAHAATRFPLLGNHAVLGCRSCHRRAAEGDFRGARPECESCHLETLRQRRPHPPHLGAVFLRGCDRCHGQTGWRPARFAHDTWPLTGAHHSTPCTSCHVGGVYRGVSRDCVGCHDGQQTRSSVDHGSFPNRRSCDSCHSTRAWTPAHFDEHTTYFPLSGPHGGQPCARCHMDSSNIRSFTCFDCHRHSQSRADSEHRGIAGYSYDSNACYRCHSRGRAEE